MRLALADIPKRFRRHDGDVSVTPRALHLPESREALATLIGLYEASLGQSRADFPDDRPAQIVGDVRLARCLTACLVDWYRWAIPEWPQPATAAESAALVGHGIDSPSTLRLALYDAINATHGGFLSGAERGPALDDFAASLDLSRDTLDALRALDDPRRARLTRLSDKQPTPAALAARYNQLAIEGLLSNASEVIWRLDALAGARLGETVKRVCFLARRMGVSYEVSFDESGMDAPRLVAERATGYAAPSSLERARLPVLITLHGPREVMGGANSYGDRLARLCRGLLGYRRVAPGSSALGDLEGLTGVATVHLHGRACRFPLDQRFARLLRPGHIEGESGADTPLAFDSSLEARLHADFAALERAGETAGWRLEREPEPILLNETILVPDFAMTRENRRVYLEIAGYWRPDYRLRKARKLAALRGAVALIVAAPEDARAEFAGLEISFPFLWYHDDAISAPALIESIQRAYDDFADRLASLDLDRLLDETQRRGVIPTREAAAAFRCYTRAEVAQAVQALAARATHHNSLAPEWVEGLGLCSPPALDTLASEAATAVTDAGGRMPLTTLAAALSATQPVAEIVAEVIAIRAGMSVERASLFAAEVVMGETDSMPAEAGERRDSATTEMSRRAQPRKPVRRTHSGVRWTVGTLFPDPSTDAGDGTAPDATPPPPRGNIPPRSR